MNLVDLLPPSIKHLQFGRFLKNGKNHIASSKVSKLDLEICTYILVEVLGQRASIYPSCFDETVAEENIRNHSLEVVNNLIFGNVK